MCGFFCIGFIDFMLAGRTLTDFPNIFSPNNFKRNDEYNSKIFYDKCLKMAEHDFHETHNICPNLNDQLQFRLNKISEIKDYFVAEIKERELMSERVSYSLIVYL